VFSVDISRQWPDTLIISVQEQIPVARWNKNSLLNQYGDSFENGGRYTGPELPVLFGPEGHEIEMMDRFTELNNLMRSQKLEAASLKCDERKSCTLALLNGITIKLGRYYMEQRAKRFLSLYEQEIKFANYRPEIVDMRYRNGAAIEWANERFVQINNG
jgi:cell division protein FtsQ